MEHLNTGLYIEIPILNKDCVFLSCNPQCTRRRPALHINTADKNVILYNFLNPMAKHQRKNTDSSQTTHLNIICLFLQTIVG